MQELIKQMTSLSWWVGVVIVGILTSLIAAYLKPRIDKVLGYVSDRYSRRNEQRAKDREEQIQVLRSDKQEQIMLALSLNSKSLSSFISMLSLMLVIIFIAIIMEHIPHILAISILGLSALSFLIIISNFWRIALDYTILEEIRKSSKSKFPESISTNFKNGKE